MARFVFGRASQLAAYAFLLADKMMEHSDTCSKKSSKDMFMEDLKDPEFYSQVCNRLGINAGGR